VSLSTDSLIAMVPDRFGCRTSEFDGGNPRGYPETHILGDTFYSQAPLRFGGFIAKISVAPKSPELRALTQAPLNVNGVPNGLREAVLEFFRRYAVYGKLTTTNNGAARYCRLRPSGFPPELLA
jgi:hypothetical protein